MKLFTFIGTGHYQSTKYVRQDNEEGFETELFPLAAVKLYEPEDIVLVTTKEGKKSANYDKFVESVDQPFDELIVPLNHDQNDVWNIFNLLTQSVGPSESIILDITHSFRSLPITFFTCAFYLETAKNVSIEKIIYGNYEAERDGKSPILDFSPMVELLEWISSADQFNQAGDGVPLGNQLERLQSSIWQEQDHQQGPTQLSKTGGALRSLTEALHLTRPREVSKYAGNLIEELKKAREEVSRWAQPFAVILNDLIENLEPLTGGGTESPLTLDMLERHLSLINFYLSKSLTVQALTLEREWVINWGIYVSRRLQGIDPPIKHWLDPEVRKSVKGELKRANLYERGKNEDPPSWINELDDWRGIAEMWNRITDNRNQIAHCGMRKNPSPPEKINEATSQIAEKLNNLLDIAAQF